MEISGADMVDERENDLQNQYSAEGPAKEWTMQEALTSSGGPHGRDCEGKAMYVSYALSVVQYECRYEGCVDRT